MRSLKEKRNFSAVYLYGEPASDKRAASSIVLLLLLLFLFSVGLFVRTPVDDVFSRKKEEEEGEEDDQNVKSFGGIFSTEQERRKLTRGSAVDHVSVAHESSWEDGRDLWAPRPVGRLRKRGVAPRASRSPLVLFTGLQEKRHCVKVREEAEQIS